MRTHLQQLLLSLKDRRRICSVNEQPSIVQLIRDSFSFAPVFELRQVLHMLGHVRAQDHADQSLTKEFHVVLANVLEKVKLWLEHDTNRLSCVVVLLDGLIVVAESSHGHFVDVVRVVEAIMVIVVACCRYYA